MYRFSLPLKCAALLSASLLTACGGAAVSSSSNPSSLEASSLSSSENAESSIAQDSSSEVSSSLSISSTITSSDAPISSANSDSAKSSTDSSIGIILSSISQGSTNSSTSSIVIIEASSLNSEPSSASSNTSSQGASVSSSLNNLESSSVMSSSTISTSSVPSSSSEEQSDSSAFSSSSNEANSSADESSSSAAISPSSSTTSSTSSSSATNAQASCQEAVQMGAALYLTNCQFCHGDVPEDGRTVWRGNRAVMDIFDEGQDGYLTNNTPTIIDSLTLPDFIQAYMPFTTSNLPYSEIDPILTYITHTLNTGQDWCPGDAWPPIPSLDNSSEQSSSTTFDSESTSSSDESISSEGFNSSFFSSGSFGSSSFGNSSFESSSFNNTSSSSSTFNNSFSGGFGSSSSQVVGGIGPERKVILATPGETTGSIKIEDDKALALIDEQTVITVEATGFDWSEGPVWSKDGGFLLFSDVPQNVMYRFHPTEGISVYLEPSGSTGYYPPGSTQGSNGLAINAEGELIIMQTGDRRIAKMLAPLSAPTPEFETLVSHYNGARLNAPNDLVIHSSGDIYFTDPRFGSDGESGPGFTGVYRLTPEGEISLIDRMQSNPNGIGLSPDESKLYMGGGGNIISYDLSASGEASNKSILHRVGRVDGFDVHSSGVIFTTSNDGIALISPEGELLANITTGREGLFGLGGSTGNCVLSDDEKTLYITADGRLLSVKIK